MPRFRSSPSCLSPRRRFRRRRCAPALLSGVVSYMHHCSQGCPWRTCRRRSCPIVTRDRRLATSHRAGKTGRSWRAPPAPHSPPHAPTIADELSASFTAREVCRSCAAPSGGKTSTSFEAARVMAAGVYSLVVTTTPRARPHGRCQRRSPDARLPTALNISLIE